MWVRLVQRFVNRENLNPCKKLLLKIGIAKLKSIENKYTVARCCAKMNPKILIWCQDKK